MLGVPTVNALIGNVTGLKAGSALAATSNAQKIQQLLDIGGVVRIPDPGTYYIDETLWMYSNSLLCAVPGAVLQGPGDILLLSNNASREAAAATVTIAWTAGTVATVTWTAHGKTAGEVVTFQGATPMVYNLPCRILEVLTPNTFTIRLPESPGASASGTVLAYNCDRGIFVRDLTIDYGYTTNGAISDMRRHAAYFCNIADSAFVNYEARNVDKYGFNSCADLDCRYENIRGFNVAEVFKHYGPSVSHRVSGVYGISRDDATTIQMKEPAAFAAYQPIFGNIYRMHVDTVDVMQANGTASAAVCIYASDNETGEDITVADVIAHADDANGCQIKFGDTYTTSLLGTVTLRNVNSSTSTSTSRYAMMIAAPVRALTIDCPHPKNQDAASPTQLIRVDSASTIKSLTINNPYFVNSAWGTSTAGYIINLSGNIEATTINGGYISGATAGTRFLNIGTGTMGPITLNGLSIENASMVGNISAGASNTRVIIMRGCKCKTVTSGFDVRSLTKFILEGNTFDTMSSGVIRPTTTSGVMAQVYGGGNVNISAAMVNAAAPATWESYTEDIAVDPLTAVQLATTNGQVLISTNAGANMAGYARRTNGQWVAIGTGAAGANTVIV